MKYTFKRRTNQLPDGVAASLNVESDSYLDALQQCSNYWFNGQRVIDYQSSQYGVVTLLSGNQNGNVIGSLIDWNAV